MSAKKLKVHFLGIGGIGVSALARYYLAQGHEVSGSDLTRSEITDALEKLGAEISIGENKIKKTADLTIYSPAVPVRHQTSNKLSYPEALGELTKKHFTIAVSGTHGKSTTTSMLGLLLVKAGFDPTIIVGTKLKELGDSNCRVGKSEYLVIEADEHFGSFLNYWPKIIIITNIEADHLDYYKNLKNYIAAFKKYIGHLPEDGILINDKSVDKKALPKLRKILKVPGEHNVYDASLALATARALKIPDKISFKSLSEYRGAWRRFEEKDLKIGNCKLRIVSDYGHHPTEVRVTLKAAREKYPKKKIWCVFQPHQYQRTFYLFKDFVKTFRQVLGDETSSHLKLRSAKRNSVDKLIITDIYDVAGRETPELKNKVSAEKLVAEVNKKNIIYIPKDKILNYLKKNLQAGQVLIIMGAGDIYNLATRLTK